jgi:hypothetical protein
MRRPLLAVAALALLAACQPFQTVSEDAGHVTYRFDPQKVSVSRVYSAATDKCEFSPLGSRPAVPVREDDVGNEREIEFVCKAPGEGEDLQRKVNEIEGGVQKAIEKVE